MADKDVYLYCQVLQNCSGVKKPIKSGQKVHYKKYKAGDKILGKEYNASNIPNTYVPAIITKDRYIITKNNLMFLGEEHEAVIINDKDIASKQLREKFKSFYNANGVNGIMSDNARKSKFVVNGAITGAVILLIYAMMKGQNKTNAFMLGAVLGGVTGKVVADYYNKNNIN